MMFITPLGTAAVVCWTDHGELLEEELPVTQLLDQEEPHAPDNPARAVQTPRCHRPLQAMQTLFTAWPAVRPLIVSGAVTDALGAPRRRRNGKG